MSDDNQPIYCGNGRKIQTQYGELMKLSFTSEDLEKLQGSLDNGWVNVVVKERREPSEKGTTHYLQVDTWKPSGEGQSSAPSSPAPAAAPAQEISPEDLPF